MTSRKRGSADSTRIQKMSDAYHGGKGDRSRVKNIKTFDANFDRIFKQEKKNEQSYSKDRVLKRTAKGGSVGGAGTD